MGELAKVVILFASIWVISITVDKVLTYRHKKAIENIDISHKKRLEEAYEKYFEAMQIKQDYQIEINEENTKALEIIQEKYQQLYQEAFSGTIRNAVLNVIEQHENGVEEPFIDITYTHKKVEYQLRLELK